MWRFCGGVRRSVACCMCISIMHEKREVMMDEGFWCCVPGGVLMLVVLLCWR